MRRYLDKIAVLQLIYLLAVVVFGAYVRATGAGAGCGNHWPLCNGTVIPHSPSVKTLIEYAHRLSSGLTLPLSLILFVLIKKYAPELKKARFAALWTIFFIIMEGLLGAGLVYFEHVADNTSIYRALSMSLHLVNTFILMAFATFTWFQLAYESGLQVKTHSSRKKISFFLYSGIGVIFLVGITGAITALGDTIFPVKGAGEALRLGLNRTEHLIVQLRIYHPFIAVFAASYLIFIARKLSGYFSHVRLWTLLLTVLLVAQLLLGYFNVRLFAPVWLQLSHLLFAELIWIVFMIVYRSFSDSFPVSARRSLS